MLHPTLTLQNLTSKLFTWTPRPKQYHHHISVKNTSSGYNKLSDRPCVNYKNGTQKTQTSGSHVPWFDAPREEEYCLPVPDIPSLQVMCDLKWPRRRRKASQFALPTKNGNRSFTRKATSATISWKFPNSECCIRPWRRNVWYHKHFPGRQSPMNTRNTYLWKNDGRKLKIVGSHLCKSRRSHQEARKPCSHVYYFDFACREKP